MASKPPPKFTPSANNIRVNSIKELRDKLDYDSLSPTDKLAINLAVREYLAYLLKQPKFKKRLRRRGLGGVLDDDSSDDGAADK